MFEICVTAAVLVCATIPLCYGVVDLVNRRQTSTVVMKDIKSNVPMTQETNM